ncbi:MAG: DMT family transporter [Pseudomonadota bacterium]
MSADTRNMSQGIALIVATALTISAQDVVFKLFSSEMTLWQIFALRGLIAVPALFILGWARNGSIAIAREAFRLWPLARGLCLTMTFLAFYGALPFLSLSTVGAANYVAPIFVALLSAHVIGEAVGRIGWIGVFLGFAGVIVLLRPGSDAFSPFALLPVAGAFFYACGHIITRTRCRTAPVAALALSLNGVMCAVGLAASLLIVAAAPSEGVAEAHPYILGLWSEVDAADWLVLALLAGFTVIIGMMLAGAYQLAPPAIAATFEYSYLIFAALWDILVFDIPPTAQSLTGMAMIVVAGLLVMRSRPRGA